MKSLNKAVIFTLLIHSVFASMCLNQYIEIDGNCYFESDVEVLIDFIELNESLVGQDPLEIGSQQWENGRLKVLNLENFFNIESHQLSEIPSSIGALNVLTYLTLFSNQISFLPNEIGNLESLEWLLLNENNLTSLPSSIGNLSRLQVLWINDNELSSLPSSICDLQESCFIKADNNELCSSYNFSCIDSFGNQECSDNCAGIDFDLNSDLVVDILDLVLIVVCIVNESCNNCSDVNYDQNTNILDIIELVGIILG